MDFRLGGATGASRWVKSKTTVFSRLFSFSSSLSFFGIVGFYPAVLVLPPIPGGLGDGELTSYLTDRCLNA